MKKRTWWMICIITAIACALILYCTWVASYYKHPGPYYSCGYVSFNQTVTEEGWSLCVDHMSPAAEYCKNKDIWYRLKGNNTSLEYDGLTSIKGVASGYNITWHDRDNNDFLSLGDIIFISKTGGINGVAKKDYTFHLIYKTPGYTIGEVWLH